MNRYGSDKARNDDGRQDYCRHYSKYLEIMRDDSVVLLELGIGGEDTVLGGASLLGWQEYFSKGSIVGVDIYDKSDLDQDRIQTFICSQDDREELYSIVRAIGTPDIIIDDASHINNLTIESFKILFPLLKTGGLYVIEDVSCAYRWDFNGNTDLQNISTPTIMNYLFSAVHDINPVHLGVSDYQKKKEFTDIESIHFYPDIVFIKKKS